MNINKLNYMDKLDINEDIIMPEEFIKSCKIISLEPVHVEGTIITDYDLDIKVSGIMHLEESLTLEDIPYSFTFDLDENIANNENYLKNNGNTLDLIQVLWENILLEIPMNLVLKERTNLKGEGWELKEK